MSTRAELSETINRLLPGEANKRIRTAILQAASYSGSRTDQLRQSIDLANRVRTGLLVAGTTTILTDTSAELSGYVWVIDFAVQQPTAVATLTIDAPETTFVREDYFIGTDTGTIVYRAGTVDALGNAFPPIYDPANEVVLRIVRRNPDGSTEDVDVPESSTLIDFAEQNIIPFVAGGKLKNSGIQVIFDALGALAAFRFPMPVRGVPAINDDEFVTKSQLPNIPQYGLISGGTIQWSGTGLTYVSSLAVVAVGGLLTAPAATLTLDAADATHPRFDVLGWRYVSPGIAELFYLKGTAAASPTIPQVNPESEVEGLVILVPALATVPPSVTTENVYLDNAEWAVTFSGTGTGNANSSTNPDTGTKAVEVTAAANQFRVRFTRATALDLSTLTEATLGLRLDLKAGYSNSQNLELVFLDASNNPVSNVLQLTLNKALLDYQFIGFPLADLTFTSQTVKAIDIIYRQRGGGTHAGFWIDNVKIQGGVSQPVGTGNGIGEAPDDGQEYVRKNKAWSVATGGGTPLDPAIEAGLNASIPDSPGTLNKYVTLNLLNSYAYVQEAPINGNHYARKDGSWVAFTPGIQHAPSDGNWYASRNGAWAAFTPFTVAGTATDGHVVTSVSGVPTWAAPSGGGGSKWTDVGSGNIYRNSRVSIGHTSDPTEALDLGPSGWVKTGAGAFTSGGILFPYSTLSTASRSWAIQIDAAAYGEFAIRISDTQTGSAKTGGILFRMNSNGDVGFGDSLFAFNNYRYVTITGRSTTQGGIVLLRTSDASHQFQFRLDSGGTFLQASGQIIFLAGNADRGRLHSNGNFVLGWTGDLGHRLHIAGGGTSLLEGNVTFGANMIFNTTTGTRMGTATNQRFAFWNKTPIVQPTTAITGAARVGGGGTTITDTDTFGGYTVAQLAAIIINTGLAA